MFFPAIRAFRLRRICIVLALAAIGAAPSFGQTYKVPKIDEFFTAFSDYAKDMSGAMAVAAGMGLRWSDPYIGHLINPIPHWGASLSLGVGSFSSTNISKMASGMRLNLEPVYADKQFSPLWYGEIRIGGFRGYPFDLGFKINIIPEMGLFGDNAAITYKMQVIGADLRWRIARGVGIHPKIALGLEFDMVTTGHSFKPESDATIAERTNTQGTSPVGRRITPGDDATIALDSTGTLIALKIDIAKSFYYTGITIFGGARAGVGINATAFKLSGSQVAWGTSAAATNQISRWTTQDKIATETERLQGLLPEGGGTAKITTQAITVTCSEIAPDIQGHVGISFDFVRFHLSLSYMMDIMHFNAGLSLSVRYQQ